MRPPIKQCGGTIDAGDIGTMTDGWKYRMWLTAGVPGYSPPVTVMPCYTAIRMTSTTVAIALTHATKKARA